MTTTTPDVAEIVTKLFEMSRQRDVSWAHAQLAQEAATALTAAQAQIVALTAERNEARRALVDPIGDMPAAGEFLAENRIGDWLKVQRYDTGEIFGQPNAVIHRMSGRWWTPKRWMPLPTPPVKP
ncbi:MAG: hypothetical protein ACRED3_16465 [Bradyrhizobium sp.]